jgi:hypothetical protein
MPALGGLPLHLVGCVEHRWLPESASLCGVGIHGDGCPSVPYAHDHSPAPTQPAWLAIETEVVGHRLIDSWEAAAMKALTTFCAQHPLEVIVAPAGLFPAVSESDPLWLDRFAHLGTLAITHICPRARTNFYLESSKILFHEVQIFYLDSSCPKIYLRSFLGIFEILSDIFFIV